MFRALTSYPFRARWVVASALMIALVATLAPISAFAGEDDAAKMAEELNLTPEQREKLKAIRAEFKQTLPGKKDAMKAAREDLQTALRGTATDDDVRKKFAELQKRQDEFAQARFDKVLKIRALLTPEQRQKFKGLDHHHRHGWKHRKGGEDFE